MEALARFVLRLVLVPLGAAAAVAAGMAVMLIAHWHEVVALAAADPEAQGAWFIAFVLAGPLLALFLTMMMAYALTAATVGVLIAEMFAIRSWISHALNGGLAAWIGWSLMHDIRDDYRVLGDPMTLIAAGLAGGLAYWLIAGWNAGFLEPVWRDRPRQP